MQDYSSKDIFNANETRLFCNLLSNKTFAGSQGENLYEGKLSKL